MNIFDVMTQLVRPAILSRHDMLQADDVAAVVVEPPGIQAMVIWPVTRPWLFPRN